jgi:hypothetical protein
MRGVDGFLLLGVPALALLVGVVVWTSYRQNVTTVRVASPLIEHRSPEAVRVPVSHLDLERYALAANQRCIAGSVVQVDGSTYTQLGTIAVPVHCFGSYADRPIR